MTPTDEWDGVRLWQTRCEPVLAGMADSSVDHVITDPPYAGQPSSTVEKKARRYGWVFTRDDWGLYRQLCPACGKDPAKRTLYERTKTEG